MNENETGEPSSKAGARAPHLKPVDGDTAPKTLAPKHVAELESSGLDAATIEASGVYSEAKSAPIADVLGWQWRGGGGMIIPFVDYDSRRVVLSRVKPDRPRTRKRGGRSKPVKYEQRPATGAVPYFGPRTIAEQRLDSSTAIVWTEGEKKTLALDQLGFATVGLTGTHNFNDAEKYHEGEGLTWSKTLRKYAERFVRGKHHTIAYDSDAHSNERVMLAARRLAGLLLDTGAASVRMARIPPDPHDADRGVGVDDYLVEHGEEALRLVLEHAERVADGEEITPIAPRDPLLRLASISWLRAAKLDGGLRLPPRFEIRRDRSLWCEPASDKPDADQREIMRSAIIPTRLLDELEGDEQRVELAWHARGEWHRAIVDRKAMRDARRALAELPPGCAIDSNNAAHVVLWLGEYLRINEHRMRALRFVSSCGWQDADDERCFLLDAPITNGETSTLVADESGDRSSILEALKARGSLEAHTQALRAAFDEDIVAAMAILGSLAAPLLKPLGAPNFAINLHGDSSKGKTTMIKIAGSIYGNPSNEQWIGSWNATGTAMELRAATLSHLPLCFDEVGAGDAKTIDRWIYMLINGAGKTRGDRSLQIRKTVSWQTVVISTGEHELVDEEANTGAQVRVLQFRVARFGELDGKGVDSLRETCERNFGHVGRAWIESLVAVEDWTPYRELFAKAKASFRSKSSGTLMQRQSAYFALLCVAEHLAASTLGFGKLGGKTVRSIFEDTSRMREIQSASDRAREVVSEWVAAEPLTFPPLQINSAGALVAQTHASVKRINGVRYKRFVYVMPGELKRRLAAHGISQAEVVAAWLDAGMLEVDSGRKTRKMRWDGKRVRTVAISCESLGMDELDISAAQTSADFSDE